MIKGKKGFEFSFGWIFAIIVGAVIIFLAIYATSNIIRTERKTTDTEAGKQLGIILGPLETGLDAGRITSISFPGETRIYNGCNNLGVFGEQEISIATKSGIGEEWPRPGVKSAFKNKYIFSSSIVEDREVIVFAKPFSFPFKIADFIFILPENERYCFVDAPARIVEEITSLSPKNINLTSGVEQCGKKSKKVCFVNSGCDVDVNLNSQSVRKEKKTLYYTDDKDDATLYAAIFSDADIYECQIKRVMARASQLAGLYKIKSEQLTSKGCSSNLEQELALYSDKIKSMNNSQDLRNMESLAEELGRRNGLLLCKLF